MSSTSIFKIAESEKDYIIYGPASVEIMDKQGDTIPADLLKGALPQLLRRGRFHKQHQGIVLGDILPIYKAATGEIYRTDVKLPDARDIQMFPFLPVDKEALFVVGNVYEDSANTQAARKDIEKEILNSFSIGGTVFEGGDGRIAKIDLDDVTICQMGANSYAKFKVIAKSEDKPETEKCNKPDDKKKEETKMPEDVKPPEKKPEEEEDMKKMLETLTKIGESISKFDERLTALEKSAKPAATEAVKTEPAPVVNVEAIVEKTIAKMQEKTTTAAAVARPLNKEEHVADGGAIQIQPMTTKELAKMDWNEVHNIAESFKKGGKQ